MRRERMFMFPPLFIWVIKMGDSISFSFACDLVCDPAHTQIFVGEDSSATRTNTT